jgi:catecholate siderophore receptor
VEGYRVIDAMASYRLTETVVLRLNIYNLTDTYYFERLTGGHVVPGPGRSAVVSTSFRF